MEVLSDFLDIGMLASEETVRVVAQALKDYNIKHSVVDPVGLI